MLLKIMNTSARVLPLFRQFNNIASMDDLPVVGQVDGMNHGEAHFARSVQKPLGNKARPMG